MQPILVDIWALTKAFLLFPLVIVVPGYVLAYLSGVFAEDEKPMHWSIGLLVSIALCPALIYFLMRFLGELAAWGFLGMTWVAALFLVYRQFDAVRRHIATSLRRPGAFVLFLVFYGLAAFLLIDFQSDERLMRPLMSFDFVKHIAVTDAISRTAIPPVNPSFHPGEPMSLFYYYFWFLLCSMVDVLGGGFVGPRGAVLASIVWSGIALFYLLRFYLNRLGDRLIKGFERKHLVYGYALLLVTGMDIVPVIIEMMSRAEIPEMRVLPDALWWNDQVESWVSSVLWTPHHVGGFIACMLAFFLVLERKPLDTRQGKAAIVVIAVTFVSALGMSIWVTLVGGLFLIFWLVLTWVKNWREESLFLVMAGSLSVLLALPYVIDLFMANHFFRPSIAFQIRVFPIIDSTFFNPSPMLLNGIYMVVLPLNYSIEFGFVAMGGLLYWVNRKRMPQKLERNELFLLLLMATSFFVCTFFRSALFNNDLGWRGFLFAQFVLLLYSIPLLASLGGAFSDERFIFPAWTRRLAVVALVLSTCLVLFRGYVFRYYFWGEDNERTVLVREAYEWQDENLPVEAVIQHYPDIELFPGDNTEYFHALYGNRQVTVADQLYARAYGINDVMFDSTFVKVNRFFSQDLTSEEGLQLSSQLNIDGFFLKHTDPIWDDPGSWLAPFTPVYESACCRIYLTDSMK